MYRGTIEDQIEVDDTGGVWNDRDRHCNKKRERKINSLEEFLRWMLDSPKIN